MRVIAAAVVGWTLLTAPAFAQITSGSLANETVVSGFVGSTFGDHIDEASVDFGGSAAWLWRQSIGAEFIAGFAPDTTLASGINEAQVHNYMANAIAAVPLGIDGRWQPFVSGGVGAITFRVDDDEFDLDAPDESEFGGNVGFGLMGFADRWGMRADVRYFRQLDGDVGVAAPGSLTVEDFDYWRGNVGVAYRW